MTQPLKLKLSKQSKILVFILLIIVLGVSSYYVIDYIHQSPPRANHAVDFKSRSVVEP